MTTHTKIRMLFSGLVLAGAVSLAGCGGSEPTETHTMTTTTTEQASPVPAPMATAPLMAPAPGTVITQTTHSQTAQ